MMNRTFQLFLVLLVLNNEKVQNIIIDSSNVFRFTVRVHNADEIKV